MSAASRSSRPWLIHYFQRHSEDDAATAVPAMDFLASLPPSVEAEFGAVLEAVAAAPPQPSRAVANGRRCTEIWPACTKYE